MRLDQNSSQPCVFGRARQFQVIEAARIDGRSTVNVQIHRSFKVIGQMTHAAVPLVGSILLLAIHPATAAIAAATATVTMGMEKLAVCLVARPTAHIANAPAREPQPLRSPMAVDTCVAETSCARVRYTAIQMPRPKLTSTRATTAPLIDRIGTVAQHTTPSVARMNTIRRAARIE